MKKTITLLSLTTLASALLVGCGSLGGESNQSATTQDPAGETSAKEVFLTQAVTGLQLASPSALSAPRKLKAGPASEEELAAFKEVLPTVDLLFDNGKAFDSTLETVNQEIEGITYEFKETITHLSADLSEVTYTLVYNKEAIVDEDDDDDDDKPIQKAAAEALPDAGDSTEPLPEVTEPAPDTSEPAPEATDPLPDTSESVPDVSEPAPENSDTLPQEIEKEWKLEGYAYLDEETRFPFLAKVEEEQEGNESEMERFFQIDTGVDSRILVEEEYEVEGLEKEQELHYTVVQNGVKTLDYKIELEQEGNENELEIEIGKEKFEVERAEKDGEIIYSIERKTEAGKVVASFKKVIDEEGNVSYEAI